MSKPTLVHKATGKPVQIGDEVTGFRGGKAIVTGWDEPRSPGSSGRIYTHGKNANANSASGFYPAVFNCEWVGRTDR